MISKQDIRGEIAAKRKALDPRWVAAASARIAGHVQSLPSFHSSGTVALYKAVGGEVDVELLFPECWRMGKRTCVPVFHPASGTYEMVETTPETRFQTGHYGIGEPVGLVPPPVGAIDLMVVPGVAFDPQGNRLGRGGGYYDRLLEHYVGFSIAVAFDFQVLPEIPTDQHDIPVDAIVTETKILKV